MSVPDISAIIAAHGEGAIAGLSLRSMVAAAEVAVAAGLSVELMAVLDAATPATRRLFADCAVPLLIVECDLRDQGAARNLATARASGRFAAFLDGDDLWSDNWLVAGHAEAVAATHPTIVHPEFNWFFGERNSIFVKSADDDPDFDREFLRLGNYWDAMAFAPRALMLELPFTGRDLAAGWALEDWNFNCRTVAAGVRHRIAPGTIHFKRRRLGSQHSLAIGAASLPPMCDLFDYGWYDGPGRDAGRPSLPADDPLTSTPPQG